MKAIALILVCLIALGVVCVLPVKAQYKGSITINADGSVSPSTAPIQVSGNVYTLTSDVTGRITVNGDNLVLDGNGYTLIYGGNSPPGSICTLLLNGASNSTVKNLTVIGGWFGVSLLGAYNDLLVNNTVLETGVGNLSAYNPNAAINVEGGGSNIIRGNNLANNYVGIRFSETNNNLVIRNTLENSDWTGIVFWGSSNNTVYHNNFVNNSKQVHVDDFNSPSSRNVWDAGYPLGGNYWSDYKKKYPDAAEIDSSGIGDTAYVIDSQNEDRYPLMEPFTSATYLLQTTPPGIGVLSPTPASAESNVSLVFTVDKLVDWTGYSLDSMENVTVTGNTTLTDLSSGLHNVTVYANDTYGNIGASETVAFTIPEPFPIVPVAALSGALIAVVVGAGIVLYYKRRRRSQLFS